MFEKRISRRGAMVAGIAALAAAPLAAGTAFANDLGTNAAPKLYIDPGHGGSDSGAVGHGLQEKDLTLDIALRTRSLLQQIGGVDIRMSRESDIDRSLAYRSSDANAWGADLFVSIHINAGGGTGFESFRYTTAMPETVAAHQILHPAIHSGMSTVAGVTDRGMKAANFHVLRETSMRAILTENLFIDTASDAGLLANSSFIAAVAQGHVNGIRQILGV